MQIELNRLLELTTFKELEAIVVADMRRLSRSRSDLVDLRDEPGALGVGLISAEE